MNTKAPTESAPQGWLRHKRHALAHTFAHSLRFRLVALFLLLALGMAGIFVAGMQFALGVGWRDVARPVMVDYIDRLAADIGSPPSVERAQALVQRLPLRVRISGPNVNWRSDPETPDYQRHWRDDHRWHADEPRLLERTTADGHRIEFGLSVAAWAERPRNIGWITLGALLLLTTLAYLRVRKLLRPLDDIGQGVRRFGAGEFDQPIAVQRPHHPDELGELAQTVNTMATDIAQMLDAKRGLLLAISHELRSPLTRARLHTELLPETADVQPSRDALLRELSLMRDLVTDLLESERLATPHAALHREVVDLGAVAREVVQRLAAAHPQALAIALEVEADLPPLLLDPTRMRLLLRNLLDNALRHGAGATQGPVLTVQRSALGTVRVSVRDFGPGVPEEHIAQLAQAFYRPDTARGRAGDGGGGVGLGLYLCRLVVQAHGGILHVENSHPGLRISFEFSVAARPEG
jgi:signal transduction histidine kinase